MKQSLNIEVQVDFFKEGEYFIAYAPAINLSAYGNSEKEAKDSFEISSKLFFDELINSGNLEKALLDLGWKLSKYPTPQFDPPTYFPTNQNLTDAHRISSTNQSVAIPV